MNEKFTVTETIRDDRPVFILKSGTEQIVESEDQTSIAWFCALLNKAEYFVTGPIA